MNASAAKCCLFLYMVILNGGGGGGQRIGAVAAGGDCYRLIRFLFCVEIATDKKGHLHLYFCLVLL